MNIPGTNLLSIALSVMGNQLIKYYAQIARDNVADLAADGTWLTRYADGVDVEDCSVQAVDRDLYESMGLDYQKNYVWLFVPQTMIDLHRDVAGDRFGFNSKKYQLESATDWQPIDGWTAVRCVEIGADNGAGADA